MEKPKLFLLLLSASVIFLSAYFEPANAARINRYRANIFTSGTDATVILNSTSGDCQFYPNPISPDQSIVAVSDIADPISIACVIYVGGGASDCILENEIYFPGTIEANILFEPIKLAAYIPIEQVQTGSVRYSFSSLPVGNYIFTAKTVSGIIYTSKFTVSQ